MCAYVRGRMESDFGRKFLMGINIKYAGYYKKGLKSVKNLI